MATDISGLNVAQIQLKALNADLKLVYPTGRSSQPSANF
jgi:hypothetical protein